jgi:hypothetical protein
MPLLPTKNNLDYNPNSIVNASKTIKSIALENMKNPVTDPDMKTLSSMEAERNLKGNLELLGKFLIDVESDLLRLTQLSGTSIATGFADLLGSGMMRGGVGSDADADMGLGALFTTPPRPRGRPKGSKNKAPRQPKLTSFNLSKGQTTIPTMFSAMASRTPSVNSGSTVSQRRLVRQQRQGRFQPILTTIPANPQAVPFGDPDDSDPDDDASSLPSSASTFASRTNSSHTRSGSVRSQPHYEINANSLPYILTSIIISLNSKIQKMDFFLNSKIKPAYRKFDASQQAFLAKFLQTIYSLYQKTFREVGSGSYITDYSTNLEQFIINNVDAGDNLLATLKRNIDKLILDTTITLNASRQLIGEGDTSVNTELADDYALRLAGFVGSGRSRKAKMMGCGRNFYGETINNSRDIPTIRRSYQDCTTKYLL